MHNIFVKGLNRIKWVIMPAMFLKYLRVSAQLIRSLNLAREPLGPAKKAPISNCEKIFLSHEATR